MTIDHYFLPTTVNRKGGRHAVNAEEAGAVAVKKTEPNVSVI